MHAVAFTTGQFANQLLLLYATEVEATYVSARRGFVVADLDILQPAGNFCPHRFLVIQGLSRLIHIRQLHGGAEAQFTCIGPFLIGENTEQGGFTRTVRTNDADNAAGRQVETQIVEQQFVTEGLLQSIGLNDQLAQTRAGRNVDFVGFVTFLEFL